MGLFQINSVWKETGGGNLFDLETNINCAKLVLKKQGLNAWITWKEKRHLCENRSSQNNSL
jgi:hypothetical protein